MRSALIIGVIMLAGIHVTGQVSIKGETGSPRLKYACDRLNNYIRSTPLRSQRQEIYLEVKSFIGRKEGYRIVSNDRITRITGNDETGLLYGVLDYLDRLKQDKKFPDNYSEEEAPEMVLRGQCIGIQKPYYLPGHNVYEYPYTPGTFPWLYNKKLWIQVLDSMVDNRMNSLYLWNGHPFASLVRLKEYPYAVEVPDSTFKKNEEMYRFITSEADKRGIWVIQMFYNIIVSKPFADYHKIKTQDRERPITPLLSDYTRKSIAAFVEKYPNVGLMVCLGEAMQGTGPDDIEWFTKTIIPGVQDGLAATGKTTEPPIVLRAHDTDAPAVMKAALPLYKNLYTEAKFNGEALTYARPRGSWAELHQALSKLGSVQIENVHILANLEPFRYGSPDFIQQSVIGMHEVMGGNGLHLYPQASYWDWPYSADSVKGKRLLQIERDWIWYKAWARYAWKAKRDRAEEMNYWAGLLAEKYGCSLTDGLWILKAYEETGEIAPKLLRRFGITDGNRQTLTLGMLMTQLINPYRYGLFTLLYDSEAPEGEMLLDYADKQAKGLNHTGETPYQVITDVRRHAGIAYEVIHAVKPKKNIAEFNRLKNDILCYHALAWFYSQKAEAALMTLRYKYTMDTKDLDGAAAALNSSVASFERLTRLTKASYLYANSMQTQQRKIPMRGVNGTFKHWKEMLPVFEKELKTFQYKIDSLKNQKDATAKTIIRLPDFGVSLFNNKSNRYTLDSLSTPFEDTGFVIRQVAPELKELRGVRTSFADQLKNGTFIQFNSSQPVKLLVGYFKKQRGAFVTDTVFLKEPELETNAGADDYGQSDIKISNAVAIDGLPPVNIHVYSFAAGEHTLKLGKGVCLILGFIQGNQVVPVYDAGLMSDKKGISLDWLFE